MQFDFFHAFMGEDERDYLQRVCCSFDKIN